MYSREEIRRRKAAAKKAAAKARKRAVEARKKTAKGVGVHRAKDAADLFRKLGI
jgi:hypothetical protein